MAVISYKMNNYKLISDINKNFNNNSYICNSTNNNNKNEYAFLFDSHFHTGVILIITYNLFSMTVVYSRTQLLLSE